MSNKLPTARSGNGHSPRATALMGPTMTLAAMVAAAATEAAVTMMVAMIAAITVVVTVVVLKKRNQAREACSSVLLAV
jgi:hypothetical protein